MNASITSPVVVREQLKRLLAHPLFTNSKRYPVLLAYTVEQTLLGNGSSLKERTIGIEAFGREPNYDVNLDPVVRTTAAEVRKRLIQYYYDADHSGELVIEMPVGSYVPIFREPATSQIERIHSAATAKSNSFSISREEKRQQSIFRFTSFNRVLILGGLFLAALIGFGIGRFRFAKAPSNLERFWDPITASSSRITYCLGVPMEADDRQTTTLVGGRFYGGLDLSDVTTLARSIVPLVPRNRVFRVLASSETGFEQLREAPFVLIGAYDNAWTMRITQNLPFGYDYGDNHIHRIVDRAHKKFWTVQWQVPNVALAEDYAIVARIHDEVTGQPVIILGGILSEGTEAAGEVISNPLYLDTMLQKAPSNWQHMNLEAIIETHVIDGHAGPPTVIDITAW